MAFRTLALLTAAAAAVIVTTSIAIAGWCWGDPVIGIRPPGGTEQDISIDVAVPEEWVGSVDAVAIVVTIPENVRARVKLVDEVLPEEVTVRNDLSRWNRGDDIEVVVSVRATAKGRFPVIWSVTWTAADGRNVSTEVTSEAGRRESVRLQLPGE